MAEEPVVLHQNDVADLPDAVRSQVDNATITQAPPSTGANNEGSVASVAADSPNQIEINDPARFNSTPNSASQTLAHEGTHLLQNNMPPTLAAQIPADNPSNPYDISDIDSLRASGHTISTIPREKAATIVQQYVATGSKDPQLKPWIEDLSKVPQSTIMPTKPGQSGIETTPRAPGPVSLHTNDVHTGQDQMKKAYQGAKGLK